MIKLILLLIYLFYLCVDNRSSFQSSPDLDQHCLVLDDVGKENDPLLQGECRLSNNRTLGAPAKVKSPESGLFLYVDFHGHASKKGLW